MAESAIESDIPIELQLWLSPSFPVGSFAFSHGLEWAVTRGFISDRATAQGWLGDLLAHGSARNDAILLAESWHAARLGDEERLSRVNELALALAGSRERLLETSTQGRAFIATVLAAWPGEDLRRVAVHLPGDTAYAVAVGAVAGARGVALRGTVQAYLAAFLSSLVSALVRLGAIGQTDGQRVLAALVPLIGAAAASAVASTLDDIGSAAFVADIAAQAHETLETRMFRS